MPVETYLKDKKKIESKYHQVAKRFESPYGLMHRKVISRFHRDTTETEIFHSKINNLIINSTVSIQSKINSKGRFIHIFSRTSTKIIGCFYSDYIDWTRGRFSGETIQIIVREGRIIEKIFLTPQGNRISVKRSELGFQFR